MVRNRGRRPRGHRIGAKDEPALLRLRLRLRLRFRLRARLERGEESAQA